MNLKFKKNKESDKTIINSFDKMCRKIESTKVRPLTIFKKTATNELKDFLEICKKELLNCKKWNWLKNISCWQKAIDIDLDIEMTWWGFHYDDLILNDI